MTKRKIMLPNFNICTSTDGLCVHAYMSVFNRKGGEKTPLKITPGTSLVVQWLRIRLPMQGTQVRSLVRELRSHVPGQLSPCAATTEHSRSRAHAPQLRPEGTGPNVWAGSYHPIAQYLHQHLSAFRGHMVGHHGDQMGGTEPAVLCVYVLT